MGKRLTENISSRYVDAANRLKPQQARRKIIAYVESYDDIAFWRVLLSAYEDDTRYFEVMLPSQDSLTKGKKSVLMNRLGNRLGESMIACVDSDYDYLLQGSTHTSRYMLQCPYVLQTYAYAIENFRCYAEGLHEACVAATLNDRRVMDFTAFMQLYSETAYPLFIWSVWYYRKNNLSEFSLSEFCSYVRIDHFHIRHPEDSLAAMHKRVARKLKDLEHRHPEALGEIDALRKELLSLGVTPQNTYLFIQGHHIFDNVVMRLLLPVCNFLRHEREEEINHLALHELQRQNELTAYRHSQLSVESVLAKSVYYKDSFLYKKIQRDVERLLSPTAGNTTPH